MKKKKRDRQGKDPCPRSSTGESQVILGVRVSETERLKIKLYAVRHGVTVADLVRQYISSLPEDE